MSAPNRQAQLLKISGLIIFGIPCAVYRAWVVTMLWGWFIAPMFHMGPLRMVYAYGLMLCVSLFTTKPPTKEESENTASDGILFIFIGSSFFLLFGWITSLFI